MNIEQSALWKRIQLYELDEVDAVMPFSRRLARENGWSLQYTMRVIEEYKRFVFLAITSAHPVTPSDEIDQVWHLHLLYTKSYWEDFCGNILKQPLHHQPTKGGVHENLKFQDWYSTTKRIYQFYFDNIPPSDIWKPHGDRFSLPLHLRRVDTTKNWVIPKKLTSVFVISFLIAIVSWNCIPNIGEVANFVSDGVVPIIVLVIILTAILAISFTRQPINKSSKNDRRNESTGDVVTGIGDIHDGESKDLKNEGGENNGDGGSESTGDTTGCSGCSGCGGGD